VEGAAKSVETIMSKLRLFAEVVDEYDPVYIHWILLGLVTHIASQAHSRVWEAISLLLKV
jgi:hypothetical protein